MQGMLEHFATSWSARTRAGSSTSGRRVPRRLLRGRQDRGRHASRRSTSRSGTSSASRSACRSTSCSAAPAATASRASPRPACSTARNASSGRRSSPTQGWRYLRFVPGMGDAGWTDDRRRRLRADGVDRAGGPLDPRGPPRGGSAVELSIDFHHRLSVAEAALFCQRVEPLHLISGRADPRREPGGLSPTADA